MKLSQPLKVLIVEDSKEDAELLVAELRNSGFEPDWQRVDTEADYLDRLQGGVNLVLADYQMPQFTGLRALELLKQGGLDVPFFMVSSVAGEDTAVAAMKHGATDYLIKDRLTNLGQSVAQALEATRLRAERRRVEQRLLLQCTALETADDGVVITDAAGIIVWVNPAFTRQSGYTSEEAMGETFRLLKSGEHDIGFYQNLWGTILAGKTWRGCFTNRRKNGSLYFDEHTITPVRSPEGAVTHFVTIMNDVTERRVTENALTAAHSQLRALLEHSPAVLFALEVTGTRGTPRFSSGNITRLLGFQVEETLSPDWWSGILHPDDRKLAEASIARTLAMGSSRTEYRVRHRDGSYRWVEDNLRLVRDGTGQPADIAGVWTNITERKLAEEALVESERRLHDMLENIRLIAVTLDQRGIVTFCNNHLLQLTGWQRHEIIGANWFEKFIPASDDTIRKLFFETVAEGKFPAHHWNSIATKTGEVLEIAWNNTTLRDSAGNVAGTASIGEDVTARRRAMEALRVSEERFRQVVENILEVFWMTDVKNNLMLYVSPAYEIIWGRSCDSLYASPKAWLDNIHELDRARVEAAMPGQVLGQYDETYRIVRPDGMVRWVRDRAFPIRNERGTVARVVGVAEDITERKNLEEQSLRGQRLECVGMLAAGIAHDLNNVLAPIGMAAPLLRTNAKAASDLRILDILEQCAQRGAGLVKQILGFVHGIGGEPRLIQVKHLLQDITGVISETFPKSIVLRDDVPAGLWPIMANPTQIHQVLLNLCINARDAMATGGTLRLSAENVTLDEQAALNLSGAKSGNWLMLQVEDTGTGIPVEMLARVWEPFFTTKSAEHGTGLGLSTVRGIVEGHGGFILLDTETGRGTTFRVYLPAEVTGVEPDVAADMVLAARGHSELILLVDDEELIRDTAHSILTRAGYRVLTAVDGLAALRLVDSNASEIVLVITDRDMPLGGGMGLATAIRGRKLTMKILLISGLSGPGGADDAEKVADAFIAKPFSAESLLRAVEQLLCPSSSGSDPLESVL